MLRQPPAAGERRRVLIAGQSLTRLLPALRSIMEAHPEQAMDLLVLDTDPEVLAADLAELLEAFPDTGVRAVASAGLESLFASTELWPGLVLLGQDTDTELTRSCLRLARCPIIIAN